VPQLLSANYFEIISESIYWIQVPIFSNEKITSQEALLCTGACTTIRGRSIRQPAVYNTFQQLGTGTLAPERENTLQLQYSSRLKNAPQMFHA